MKKIVVIHQPDFLPYLGFFHRLLDIDLFVILDDVQFLKSGWHHRDQIKVSYGNQKKWLSLSVKKRHTSTSINEIYLSMDIKAKKKLLNHITENYSKAKFYSEIKEHIVEMIMNDENNLPNPNPTPNRGINANAAANSFAVSISIFFSS